MKTQITRRAKPTLRKIRIDRHIEEIEIDTSIPKTFNVTFLNKKGVRIERHIIVNEKKNVAWY